MDRKALRPEPIQGHSRTRKVLVVREQQPESEDGLGQKVENAVEDGFGVGGDDVATFAEAPGKRVQNPEDTGKGSAHEEGAAWRRAEAVGVAARLPG